MDQPVQKKQTVAENIMIKEYEEIHEYEKRDQDKI